MVRHHQVTCTHLKLGAFLSPLSPLICSHCSLCDTYYFNNCSLGLPHLHTPPLSPIQERVKKKKNQIVSLDESVKIYSLHLKDEVNANNYEKRIEDVGQRRDFFFRIIQCCLVKSSMFFFSHLRMLMSAHLFPFASTVLQSRSRSGLTHCMLP